MYFLQRIGVYIDTMRQPFYLSFNFNKVFNIKSFQINKEELLFNSFSLFVFVFESVVEINIKIECRLYCIRYSTTNVQY